MTHAAAASPPGTAPLWRNRPFLLLVTGQFISRAGDALQGLASIWLVLELTDNNPLAAGVAGAIEFLPFLLFGLAGGVLVDRWDRRRVMAGADLLRALLLIAIPALHAAGRLEVWHIVLVGFLLSSLGRFFLPARQALLPDLVGEEHLTRANALSEGAAQVAFIAGPAAGGILLAAFGAVNLFTIDAVTFLISGISVLLIRVTAGRGPRAPRGLIAEAREGWAHVRRTRIFLTVGMLSIAGTVAFAPIPVLLPLMVREHLGGSSRMFGVLQACFFVGAVAGSVVIARKGKKLHRGQALVTAMLAIGLIILAMAGAMTAVILAIMLALLGAIVSAFNVSEYALLQELTPADLRGRVFALANVTAQAPRIPVLVLTGLLAGSMGVRATLVMMAAAALIAGAIAMADSRLRETR